MYAGGECAECCRVVWPVRWELKSWRKDEGIFAAKGGAADADTWWTMIELVGTGSGQFTTQHRRACDVAAESTRAKAALQQSIIFMCMPVCIWTPAETLTHKAATRTRYVNDFNIARAESTDRFQTLSSI